MIFVREKIAVQLIACVNTAVTKEWLKPATLFAVINYLASTYLAYI